MKAIVLSGGAGTRLHPATGVVSKQLIPVYDKPMIYYSVATAITAGATELLFISSPEFLKMYSSLFRHGRQIGLPFTYVEQEKPRGIAEALLIAEDFIGHDPVMLILGDNIFCGLTVDDLKIPASIDGAHVVAYEVQNPRAFGVITFDESGRVLSIDEKPPEPRSNWIVPGVYFYSNDVVRIARSIKPSDRGELEITAVNQEYLRQGRLTATRLPAHVTWFDCGHADALLDASNFIAIWERRHNRRMGCPAEASYRRGLISERHIDRLCTYMLSNEHRDYLKSLPMRVRKNGQSPAVSG
jgi:glucose-1-phosphate thymidylyltransferase